MLGMIGTTTLVDLILRPVIGEALDLRVVLVGLDQHGYNGTDSDDI